MTSVEQLPADQRAVLSLLLTQQKSYSEIAEALDLSQAAVSERAYAALSSLAEPEKAPGGKRRAEVGDYLLGQQSDEVALKTKQSLTRSAADRAWARAAAASLGSIAGALLPAIPGADLDRATSVGEARSGSPQDNEHLEPRRGGIFLIAALVLLIALGVGFGLGRVTGGSDSPAAQQDSTSSTNASNVKATAIAQAALKPPAGGPAPKALGFAGISAQGSQRSLSVVAKGLPAAPKGSQYGVWLSSSGQPAVWLGYLQTVGSSGVGLQGVLNGDPKTYSGVLLTLEKATPTPTNPSKSYLVGPLNFAS